MDIPLPPEFMDPEISTGSDGAGNATVASVGLFQNGTYDNRSGTGSESQMASTPLPAAKIKFETGSGASNGSLTARSVSSPTPSGAKDPDFSKPAELKRLWKPLRTNVADFTAWTVLLSYVEQQENILYIREAYDLFFSRYPYCYGYWKKYSELERRFGSAEQGETVVEQGVQAVPLSIELWLYYLEFAKDKYKGVAGEGRIRQLYSRAVDAAGLDFKSDDLWDSYIQWEKSIGQHRNVFNVYDRLLQIPTLQYARHFEEFQQLVNTTPLTDLLTPEEFQTFKSGMTEPSEDVDASMRQSIIEARKPIYQKTETEAGKRWTFEQNIRRPYFHIKPLEQAQLKNWHDYLDFEMTEGQAHRIVFLFERCLVACALYEEFWRKYFTYLRKEKMTDYTRYSYQRVCTYHLPNKTGLHLDWAGFEEEEGNLSGAMQALQNGLKHLPNRAILSLRQIGLLRRMQQEPNQIQSAFDALVNNSDDSGMMEFFLIKQARYYLKIKNEKEKAMEILRYGLKKDPTSASLMAALIDCEMQQMPLDVAAVIKVFDELLSIDTLPLEQKVELLERKILCLEDFGTDIAELQNAHRQYYELSNTSGRGKKRAYGEEDEEATDAPMVKKVETAVPTTPIAPVVAPIMASYGQTPVVAPPQITSWPPVPPVAVAPAATPAYPAYPTAWPGQYPQANAWPYPAAPT